MDNLHGRNWNWLSVFYSWFEIQRDFWFQLLLIKRIHIIPHTFALRIPFPASPHTLISSIWPQSKNTNPLFHGLSRSFSPIGADCFVAASEDAYETEARQWPLVVWRCVVDTSCEGYKAVKWPSRNGKKKHGVSRSKMPKYRARVDNRRSSARRSYDKERCSEIIDLITR